MVEWKVEQKVLWKEYLTVLQKADTKAIPMADRRVAKTARQTDHKRVPLLVLWWAAQRGPQKESSKAEKKVL